MSTETRRVSGKAALPEDFVRQMVAKAGGTLPAGPPAPVAPAEVPVSPRLAPAVTALLVVNDVHRLRFARAAVNNFVRQTYTHKHLVVVNGIDPATSPAEETKPDGDVVALDAAERAARCRVLTRDHPWVTEVTCEPGLSHGAMRNLALGHVPADCRWAILWEDDAFAHAGRIAFQMAHRPDDHTPVLLRRELRVDVVNAVAVPFDAAAGVHSTLLFPLGADMPKPFPDTTGYDAAEFWIKNWGGSQVVVQNAGEFPQAVTQVSFWHGRNALTRQQFLGEYADPKWYKKAATGREEVNYLNTVVGPVYGASFLATSAEQPPA